MGYILLITKVLNASQPDVNCEVDMKCDANVLEFMGAAASILVEAEIRIPAEDRARFRADFLEALNKRRKEEGL